MKSSSSIQAHLRNLPGFFWALFLVFSALALVVMPFHIGEGEIRSWVGNPDLQEALVRFVGAIDAVWVLLAALNLYIWLIRVEGLSTARRWGMIVVLTTAVIAWIGAKMDQPFGPFDFTDRMGTRMGGVLPFTVPLLWFTVIIASRYTVLRIFPRAPQSLLALGTGVLAVLTDLNLEFVAWKVRAYWIWYPANLNPPAWPPVQNYIGWFLLAAALSFFLREERVGSAQRRMGRPLTVLALMNLVFLATNIAWLLKI